MILIILLNSCNDDLSTDVDVITEDVIYLSAERITLSGRVLARGPIDLSDHGFVIADNEQIQNPIFLNKGEKSLPGRFVVDFSELQPQVKYWFASFIEMGGERIFSDTSSFTTLTPELISFSPRIASPGETIEINGANFTNDTQVLFGDQTAEILSISAESIIRAVIPRIDGDSVFTSIHIISQGVTSSFEVPFEYVSGRWTLIGAFQPEEFVMRDNFSMQNGEYVICGLGDRLFSMELNEQIFMFDKANATWSSLPYDGETLVNSFSAWPYFGSGTNLRNAPSTVSTSFFSFNGQELVSEGELIEGLENALAYNLGDFVYLFGGTSSSGSPNRTVYRYFKSSRTWEALEGRIFQASNKNINFLYEEQAYYIGEQNRILRFDLSSEMWEDIAPEEVLQGELGIAEVVNDKVFVGLSDSRRDIWEVDLTTFEWKRKNFFPGSFRGNNVASWVNNGRVYVMRYDVFNADTPMEIWELQPDIL